MVGQLALSLGEKLEPTASGLVLHLSKFPCVPTRRECSRALACLTSYTEFARAVASRAAEFTAKLDEGRCGDNIVESNISMVAANIAGY